MLLHPVWLFPATYAVHLLEEYFAGDGFPVWTERAFGIPLSVAEFLVWNAWALALMCAGAVLASRDAKFRFVEIALATAVLGNAAAHVIGSVATWTYSPGLVTGVLVWAPLGWIRLRAVSRVSSHRARVAGAWVGAVAIVAPLAVLAAIAVKR